MIVLEPSQIASRRRSPRLSIAALGIAALATGLLAGCGRAPEVDEGPGDKHEAPPAIVQSTSMRAARAHLDAPVGWAQRAEGAWSLSDAPERHAHLAVIALAAADAVPARVAEAIGLMGGAAPETAQEQAITIGPEKLPARAASGSCRFGAARGRMQYAVVDTGDGERALLVYASAEDAPEDAQRTAFTAIASLRRK